MIELIVKLPEGAFELLKTKGVDWLGAEHILSAVANGTPLPKGHGRLIDEREVANLKLCKDISCSECPFNKNGCGIAIYVDGCKTVVEADKEGAEK